MNKVFFLTCLALGGFIRSPSPELVDKLIGESHGFCKQVVKCLEDRNHCLRIAKNLSVELLSEANDQQDLYQRSIKNIENKVYTNKAVMLLAKNLITLQNNFLLKCEGKRPFNNRHRYYIPQSNRSKYPRYTKEEEEEYELFLKVTEGLATSLINQLLILVNNERFVKDRLNHWFQNILRIDGEILDYYRSSNQVVSDITED